MKTIFAKLLIKEFGITEKEYRKRLSALRAYLDVIEVKMSRKAWGEIDYESVPSKANLLYEDAFLRNDQERRTQYLQALERGEVEINSSVLFPHDIVHKYFNTNAWDFELNEYNITYEEMWKALPDFIQGAGNTICVSDGSGSMTMPIGNCSLSFRPANSLSCLEVALALSIYFAERSSGQFKDKFITFSENPQFVDLSKGKSLRDKLGIATSYTEVANTDIEAVFELILKAAVKGKMKQEDLPKNILILSDMEFDGSVQTTNYEDPYEPENFKKLFQVFAERFEEKGYKLPRLVFWNLNSRTNTIPVKENEFGVALVSGFSPTILKMVLSDAIDPFVCLLEMLNTERYQAVEDAVKDCLR